MTRKFLVSHFVEDVNTRRRLSFSFPDFWYSSFEFNFRKRDGIRAIKFEAARMHFLSDVMVAVADVLALKAPLYRLTMYRPLSHNNLFQVVKSDSKT